MTQSNNLTFHPKLKLHIQFKTSYLAPFDSCHHVDSISASMTQHLLIALCVSSVDVITYNPFNSTPSSKVKENEFGLNTWKNRAMKHYLNRMKNIRSIVLEYEDKRRNEW
jgi:hypothetical protein